MLLGHGQRRAGKGTCGRGQPYQPGVPGHLGQGAYSLLVEMLRQWGKYFKNEVLKIFTKKNIYNEVPHPEFLIQ